VGALSTFRQSQFDSLRLKQMWSMCASMPSFRVNGCSDAVEFSRVIMDNRTLAFESSYGHIFLTDIGQGRATVSFSFMDGRLGEHTDEAKGFLRWAMKELGLSRIQAVVPLFWKAYLRWLETRMGFTVEGIMRGWNSGDAVMLSCIAGEV